MNIPFHFLNMDTLLILYIQFFMMSMLSNITVFYMAELGSITRMPHNTKKIQTGNSKNQNVILHNISYVLKALENSIVFGHI